MRRLYLSPLVLLLCLVPVRGQSAAEKQGTVAYLQSLQQSDGGFLAQAPHADRRETINLQATVAAVRALKYFGGEPRDRDAAAHYVEKAFDAKSGGFVNVPNGEPNVIVTAVGLMGVTALKLPADPYREPAVRFLSEHAHTFEEVRMAAAGLEAIDGHSSKAKAWLEQVAQLRNPDGTYGKGDGLARATGSSVVTVLRLGGTVEHRDNVLKAMRAGQRQDGGFGEEGKAGSDLGSTYRIMRAFHMLHELPDVGACRAFVAKCRNTDGGYGVKPGEPSSVSGTYYAGSVLHWLAEP